MVVIVDVRRGLAVRLSLAFSIANPAGAAARHGEECVEVEVGEEMKAGSAVRVWSDADGRQTLLAHATALVLCFASGALA